MVTERTLSIDLDYLSRLIVKFRGVQGREEEVDTAPASNPSDDDAIDALQETAGDLSREEVRKELRGLDDRQQAELVALMWIGRGDAEPEEWDETIELARQLKDGPTPKYLLGHPLVAEEIEEGVSRLGIELPLGAASR